MKELVFNDGLVTYNLNGKYQLTINPTDAALAGRLYETFYALDEKQAAYDAEVKKAEGREIFEIARRRDAEMREMVDGVLGAGVCEALFGDMNVYAMADGLPVWANLLLAILDEMDTGMTAEQKKTDNRLAKYTAKYNKKR